MNALFWFLAFLQRRTIIVRHTARYQQTTFSAGLFIREAAETMVLLDSVMDGLTDEASSGALRDLCASQVCVQLALVICMQDARCC